MQEKELWKLYKNKNDQTAKEKLIVKYIELVKIIAGRLYKKYYGNVEYDDLVSYGIIGLIDAIEKFDIGKNVKFSTYANIRIRGAVVDQLRALDWVPRNVRDKSKKIDYAMKQLHNKYGDNITIQMLAEEMKLPVEEVNDLLSETVNLSIDSLEEKIEINSNFAIENSDIEKIPEQNLLKNEFFNHLAHSIDKLPERERMIVNLYYYSELTYKEIAEILEVSESRISQLHSKAISQLKNYMDDYNK